MSTPSVLMVIVAVVFVVFGGIAVATQDKYAVQVPGGLSLSECRGYEDWLPVAVSHPADKINQIATATCRHSGVNEAMMQNVTMPR